MERNELISKLRINYPENLPISSRVAEIRELWRNHQVIVIAGSTGSGKTTQLPKIALELGGGLRGRVGCTQPRRLAATAMARRLALELNAEYGNEVGYQVRFDDRTTSDTVLKFMTDGILLAEIRNDRLLKQYDTLIIDEAHERSLNIDFLLGFLKNLLPKRPDLKVAISSATLDVESFSKFFNNAPVLTVEGRIFPVEDLYFPPELDEDLPHQIGRAVDFLTELNPNGDILVFLPGEREIRDAADLLNGRNYRYTETLPLYARLSYAEQQKVFITGKRRRIILATNVAETSLTIPGISYCIDSGLARVKRYNPRSRIEELQIEMISQAAARQRRGRCGRTTDGVCVHLYGENDLNHAAPFTDPEIKRTGLAGVILQMALLRLPKIDRFPFMDPPSAQLIRDGIRTLNDLQALNSAGQLTPEGWKLAEIPLDPHLGKMLLNAQRRKVLPELLVLTAGLSVNNVRERPSEKKQEADAIHRQWRDERSDFIASLNLWNDAWNCGAFASNGNLRKFCRKKFLNFNRMREWRNLVIDLSDFFHVPAVGEIENIPYDQVHESLLSGIPRHIAQYDSEHKYYRGADGKKFHIFPGSGLAKRKSPPEWLLAFAVVETSRIYAIEVAEIRPDFFEHAVPHLCSKVYDSAHYDENNGFVRARERLTFSGLLIHSGRKVDFSKNNPVAAREVLIREGLLTGVLKIPHTWIDKFHARREELQKLELKLRRPGGIYDEVGVAEYLLQELPSEAVSLSALKEITKHDKRDYTPPAEVYMLQQFDHINPDDYPDTMGWGERRYQLIYHFEPGEKNDGVMICIPENELNLLPPWALDWLPPGYLPELFSRLIRALPKELRRQIGVNDGVNGLLSEYHNHPVFRDQPLHSAIQTWLEEWSGKKIDPEIWEKMELPEYLQLKLGIMDKKGRITKILRELPEELRRGSRLSGSLPGVAKHTVSGATTWPDNEPMPLELELPKNSGRIVYPALTDEGESVGKQLFLRLNEAKLRHTEGLLKLFKLDQAILYKYVKRNAKFTNEMRMSWFLGVAGHNVDEHFTAAAIKESFGVELWEIRSKLQWEQAKDHACEKAVEIANIHQKKLEEIYDRYQQIKQLEHKLSLRFANSAMEIEEHLKLLFSPGFLLRPAVWSDYPRYLRGLQLRAERMIANPGRDSQKCELLQPYINKFYAVKAKVSELSEDPELYNYWRLLEEARLAQFAPEIPLKIRAPLNQLAKI